MHTEAHVHGNISLKRGVTGAEIETAFRSWFDYVDVDSLAEATSAREDEPGIALDARRRVLEICWTGWVGRNFQRIVEESLAQLGPLAEQTAEIELTYYHDDGRDEFGIVFVGPSPEAIEEARRRRMIQDVAGLLSRQFNDAEVGEVTQLIQRLFEQQRGQGTSEGAASTVRTTVPRNTRHLH